MITAMVRTARSDGGVGSNDEDMITAMVRTARSDGGVGSNGEDSEK